MEICLWLDLSDIGLTFVNPLCSNVLGGRVNVFFGFRHDFDKVYKMMHGLSSVQLNTFLHYNHSLDQTRCHSLSWRKTDFELNWDNISSVKELSIYGINWIWTQSVLLHWTVLNNIYRSYTKMGHSIDWLLQSVWPKRLSQFPWGGLVW